MGFVPKNVVQVLVSERAKWLSQTCISKSRSGSSAKGTQRAGHLGGARLVRQRALRGPGCPLVLKKQSGVTPVIEWPL